MREKINKLLANEKAMLVLKYAEIALLLFLGFNVVLNLCYVSESLYQTIRSFYLWVAVCYLMVSVLIIRRVRLHWSQIPLLVVYGVLGFLILKPYWPARDLFKLYGMQYAAGGMGLVFLLDTILYHRNFYKKMEWKATIMWLGIFVLLIVLMKGSFSSLMLLFPALPVYLTLLDNDKHKKFLITISGGYYLAFLYTMLKSFVLVPYTGERYYGIFINHGLFGIFIGGAFVCALCWLVECITKEKRNLLAMIASGAAFLFTVVCLFINAARISQVACILVFACAVIFVLSKKNPRKTLKYIIIAGVIGILGIAATVGILAILHKIPEESLQQTMQGNIFEEFVLYWKDRADTAFNAKSRYGVIPEGSLLNAIDRFTSARISYCLLYLQRLSWFGNPDVSIEVGESFFMHPHNTYVFWLYGFGIIGGTVLIAGFIAGVVRMMWQYFKENKAVFFTLMWLIYYAFVNMGEVVQWSYQVGFIAVLMLFPLFIRKNADAQEEKKADVK